MIYDFNPKVGHCGIRDISIGRHDKLPLRQGDLSMIDSPVLEFV